jgi:hypothetical protein
MFDDAGVDVVGAIEAVHRVVRAEFLIEGVGVRQRVQLIDELLEARVAFIALGFAQHQATDCSSSCARSDVARLLAAIALATAALAMSSMPASA